MPTMTHADRDRKRKHSEDFMTSSHHQHHHNLRQQHQQQHQQQQQQQHTAPPYAPVHSTHPHPHPHPHPRSSQHPVQDHRSLYGGYVEYTTGESPVPVRHSHLQKHSHRRHHNHQEGSNRGYDESDIIDRPGKRHRTRREYTLEDVPSDGEISDTGADVGEVSFDTPGEVSSFDPSADRLSQSFNLFNIALSNLLAIVDSNPGVAFPLLDRVLGRERSSFVKTMKAMELEGTLSWLAKSRELSPDLSVAPSRVIQTTSGLTLEPIKPRQARASSHEPSSRNVSGTGSVRSISTASSVPPVPFSAPPVNPTVKRAKIWPPELPPIKDDNIRKQVFSHKSIVDGASSMIGEAGLHNERLEFLGDSYLGAIVTRYIFARFPTFREGAMTNIRSSIVGNKNIQEWCVMYKLDKHLITGEGKHAELVNRSKTLADLFEAYVGGLLLDSGPEVVDEWLKDLMEPRMKEVAEEYNREKPLNKAAKNEIARLIKGKTAKIDYRWEGGGGGNQGGYCFKVYFTGWGITEKFLGKGWGSNKTDASIRAAMNVLEEGTALMEVKRAKEKWYEENQTSGSTTASDSGTVIRHEIS